MISVSPYSTQANYNGGIEYNFREEEDIRRFVYFVLRGNSKRCPVYVGSRCFRADLRSPARISDEIIGIQMLHGKITGLRVRGLILQVTKDELQSAWEIQQISAIADRYSDYFFFSGFQTVYGVFDAGSAYEIVYAINTVSFVNGMKFRQNHDDILADELLCAHTVVGGITGHSAEEHEFDFESLEFS